MKTVRNTGGVLLAVALLAGCSERSPTTAPMAKPAALAVSGFIGDRPYTWNVQCSGDLLSQTDWYWTTGGVLIAGYEMSVRCDPATSLVSGGGTRPGAADGLHACVNGTCKQWTFDPAKPFNMQLKGTWSYEDLSCAFLGMNSNKCTRKGTGTLAIDS